MSDSTHDAIFARVMSEVELQVQDEHEQKQKQFPIRLLWLLGGVALAAAAVVLIPSLSTDGTVPARSGDQVAVQPPVVEPGEFAPRGEKGLLPTLAIHCSQTRTSSDEAKEAEPVCDQGSTLLFDVQGAGDFSYFAAFARHEAGAVVWYFPDTRAGQSLRLDEHWVDGALDRGVLLNAHSVGHYQVFGFYSKKPLTREKIRSQFDVDKDTVGDNTAVVKRGFSVQ